MAVTTGICRLGYVHLDKPYAMKPGDEGKYSVQILIPKTDTATIGALQAEIEKAKEYGLSTKWNGVAPPNVPTPIHDGDGVKSSGEPYGDECKGCYVMNASCRAQDKPRVVDVNLQDIIDPSEIYSGMYGRVSINFYPYNYNGKKGIGCGLNHVQKVKDGEVLGGQKVSAEAAFSDSDMDALASHAAGTNSKAAVDPLTGKPLV